MTAAEAQGLLDTSVFIASASGRRLDGTALPEESFVSVITRAELQAGVLVAKDSETRARRLTTLDAISPLALLPVDAAAASHWARLRVRLAESGRRVNVNDLWIASIALANDLPVVTQDDDFSPLAELDALRVVRV
ncbi:tRNA(fMet)-specific endonuclease VapC [Isoptericola sp. CG 20/1183]|uniref:Ribonuclease VapC n=1 Tax=Isoptericola halotolerans TaxID=300560 RepID=A0ABX5EG05_9MICO|nr:MULTISPECIES: type II toxin-antitoxin system VapC family toxin [Isoptericola]PRZ07696.1 tRNA(fMet)-specific endonuclease VapC [Isoptericola halotolerans]PRZ07945.1 tRNA(fMet)-specific endonuclease VapC [Isoptericola sp. CG 20/1183]